MTQNACFLTLIYFLPLTMQRPNVYWWKDVISRLCLVSSLRRGQETSKKVRSSKRTLLYNDVCTYLKNLFILNLIIFYFFPFKYWVLVPLYGCGRWWCPVDVRVGILLHRAGIQDGCSRYRDNGVSRLPLSGMGINSLGRDDQRFSNTTGILQQQQKKLCGLLVLK